MTRPQRDALAVMAYHKISQELPPAEALKQFHAMQEMSDAEFAEIIGLKAGQREHKTPPASEAMSDPSGDDEEPPVHMVQTKFVQADPERFQFRPDGDEDDGTTKDLPAEKFDAGKCDPLLCWKPPNARTPQCHVVDGHHRLAWAKRDGAAVVPVVFSAAPTAEMAKHEGILRNASKKPGTRSLADASYKFGDMPEHYAGPDRSAVSELVRRLFKAVLGSLFELTDAAVCRFVERGYDGEVFGAEEIEALQSLSLAIRASGGLTGLAAVATRAAEVYHDIGDAAASAEQMATADSYTAAAIKLETQLVKLPPKQAIAYLRGLYPSLGLSPERVLPLVEREAFTVAASTSIELTTRIQDAVADGVAGGLDSTAAVRALLDAAGCSPRNRQYAEMVVRTNAMDAYNVGIEREKQQTRTKLLFPVWQYHNPVDERSRKHHAARNLRYYDAAVPFAEVRGLSAADVCNDRCTLSLVSRYEWDDLKKAGKHTETGPPW